MTYEEAILKIATALVYEKGMTPQETARAAAEAIGLKEIMEALEVPMTKEQAMRTHPSQLEMRWARYSDHGPKDYEGYTFLDYQNYENQFDSGICGLLWVRRKKPARAILSKGKEQP